MHWKKPFLSAMVISLCCTTVSGVLHAAGQGTPAEPDVLICKDGEKFVGQLINAKGPSVTFKSDAAGQITVDWAKVQELRSAAKFAAVPEGVTLRGPEDKATLPLGTVSATDQQVTVAPSSAAAGHTMPVTNVAQLVSQPAFQKAFERRSLFSGWVGGGTAGISYTSSTQSSQSYIAALNLTRAVPGVDWLNQRSRTLLNFTEAYGEIKAPATPTSKTSITHGAIEQDWYVRPRMFLFAQALFDHNYSLGLNLQQDYGGGVGFVVIKRPNQELDVKASVDYIDQRFAISQYNQSLIGSTFGETYVYAFPSKIVFTEAGNFIPAWNNTNAYSAVASAGLTFPVYRHFGFTFGGIDNYLNNPPPGFKRNSFTLTLGLTYSLQ